jgi:hypothetical protein
MFGYFHERLFLNMKFIVAFSDQLIAACVKKEKNFLQVNWMTFVLHSQDHDSILSSSSASSEAGGSGEGGNAPSNISLLERLIRSHPVWFLPGIQRAGAFHLLQGKEEGVCGCIKNYNLFLK